MSDQEEKQKPNKNLHIHVGRDAEDIVGRDKIVHGDTNIGGNQTNTHIQGGQHNYYTTPLTLEEARKEKRYREARPRLIEAVRYTWIERFLKPAVENNRYIDLGITKHHNMVLKTTHSLLKLEEPLPIGTTIYDVFKKHGRKILILGEPASGKTITLLKLADELLDIAEKDEAAQIPIVLNLASWAQKRTDLGTWIGEEMARDYQMACDRAKSWAEKGLLILLLDGLDEVAQEHRQSCLEAINVFQIKHDIPMVVCSRLNDYEALGRKLCLAIGVCLEKLSITQMDNYLAQFGEDATGIRWAVNHNQTVQELAESPLMLSLMPLAYSGVSAQVLDTTDVMDLRRRQLLETYVQKVFLRQRLDKGAYTSDQAINWLSFLAQGLKFHSQTVFRLEEIQPTWLPYAHMWRKQKLIYGIFFTLTFGLFIPLILGVSWGLVIALISWVIIGLVVGFAVSRNRHKPSRDQVQITDREVFQLLSSSPLSIVTNAIFYATLVSMVIGLSDGLFSGLIFGGLAGLITVLISILDNKNFQGITMPTKRSFPNQSLFRLKKQEIVFWISSGSGLGLTIGLFAGLVANNDLKSELIIGISIGFVAGTLYSLLSAMRNLVSHYTIRYLLAKENLLPFPRSNWRAAARDSDLVEYLDAMVNHWLLYRVGNGWVFRHRYLLEYFAARSPVVFEEE